MEKRYLVSIGFTFGLIATLAIAATTTRAIKPLIAEAATPPAACSGETRFVAIGDTGENSSQAAKTGKAIANICATRGCDFILHLGDIIYPTGAKSSTDSQWKEKFEKPFANVIKKPWYFIMGNHDYGSAHPSNPKPADAGPYLSYALKHPGSFFFPSTSYSFKKGPVDFFGIDSMLLSKSAYRDGIIQTIKAQLEKSTAPWRIAFAHHPIVTNGIHNTPDSDIIKGYNELVCNRKVHMLISGHDHSRQWFKDNAACPKTHLVISGAAIETVPFEKHVPALFKDDDDNGFFYVRARCTTLYGAFYDDNGKIDFEYTISK